MPRSSSAKSEPPYKRPDIAAYSLLLAQSYEHWTKKPLLAAADIPHALYHLPQAVLSHGTQPDPIFCYANLKAQEIWGIGWDEFICMPSRLTAQASVVASRQDLLDEAASKGFIEGYEGVRVTPEGKRFLIRDTVLWNVVDAYGMKHGQAVVIRDWKFL